MANELNGVIIVNKHKGVTSHDIVFKIRKLYGTKKVGHTGTLDPMAEGVLPVLIGRAAKAAEYLTAEDKGYVAEIQLGITTDTEDMTGKALTKCDTLPTKAELFHACHCFVGDIKQIPPMYSALKVNGKKLCDLAREGIEIKREARSIHISKIIPEEVDENAGVYRLTVDCSKGTYIRTLCADIGAYLGCGGTMSSLLRTKSGNFTLDDSYTIEQLENMTYEERCKLLIPTEELFSDCDKVILSDFYSRLAKSGCEIYQSKIKTSHPIDKYVTMWDKDGFFALGQVKQYDNGTAIKAIKLFVI
ncbi:MAG: tRNA pseudouridine(55) synthase TruB [Clostridia bacterium]|nr:tRNA pseudouridine(55) synthase TruB [Clostridia bacterium]